MNKIFPRRLSRLQYIYYLLCLIVLIGVFVSIFPFVWANSDKSKISDSLLVFSLIFMSLKIFLMDVPRIRSIGWSPWLALLMVVPGLNVVIQFLLFLLPPDFFSPLEIDTVLKDIQQTIKSRERS